MGAIVKKIQAFASVYFNFVGAVIINNHFSFFGYDIMITCVFQEDLSLTLLILLSLGF